MSQIISKLLIGAMLLGLGVVATAADTRLPLKNLFDHKKHAASLGESQINCSDCHQFSIKSPSFDPLAKNVGLGYMQVPKKVCHECHLGKVEVARVNQCSLCHLNPEKLEPPSHKLAWKKRHGQFAQLDPSSCNGCHRDNQNSCANCHTQKNSLRPMVHRPNFRLTHGVQARANPAKCTTCHTNTNSCIQCHQRGISR